jgi:cobalt/nickel transport system permease protein
MHIPDGYLGLTTAAVTTVAVAPFWVVAWRRVAVRMRSYEIPYLALAAAFVFVIMMFNVPVPFGTTGHAVGASIVAIALGSWPAVLAVSFALIVQALVFGDGGVTAIGANCLNMAVIHVFVSLAVWHLARPRDLRSAPLRTFAAGFAAGYAGIFAAAIGTAVMIGIQPELERAADGTPLYSMFPLGMVVNAMAVIHLVGGVVEGAVTGCVVVVLSRNPAMVSETGGHLTPTVPFWRRRGFWAAAALVVALAPLGIWIPEHFGAGDAYAEWSPEEAAERAGVAQAPDGMVRLSGLWRAPVPDYAFREGEALPAAGVQYVLAALAGIVLITVSFAALGRWQRARLENIRNPQSRT